MKGVVGSEGLLDGVAISIVDWKNSPCSSKFQWYLESNTPTPEMVRGKESFFWDSRDGGAR